MAALLWLHIFACIYCTYGLLPQERIEEGIKCPPEDDPRHHQILAHPSDCSKFFLCKNGSPFLGVCPMGLHFDYDLQNCDFPEKVNCDREKVPLLQKFLSEISSVECPAKDGPRPTHLPHPTDCGKFYTCHAGIPHLKICLLGLHFNAKLQVCDFPDRAGCGKIQLSKSRDERIADEFIGCLRSKNGEFFIPNPYNCVEYSVCENGRITFYNKKCPSGLNFNIYTKACDHPDKAKCSPESGEETSVIHWQGGPGIPSPFCPTVDKKEQIFFPHQSNCTEYYMCAHGFAYKFACPARLHFNLKKKLCDYEWLAQCQTGDSGKKLI